MTLEPKMRGASGLIEQPGSPAWQTTEDGGTEVVRRFKGTYDDCLGSQLPLGALLMGPFLGLKVKSTRVEKNGTGSGQSILEERYGGTLQRNETPEQPLPDDECAIEWERQQFAIEKHPRYKPLPRNTVESIHAWIDASKPEDRKHHDWVWFALIDEFATEEEIAAATLANELINNLLRGETVFFMWAPVYTWTQYFWTGPTAWCGGEVVTSIDGPIDEPIGYEWLRAADQLSWNGKHWKLTRSWIGAYEWDRNLYPVPLSGLGGVQ